jgi:PAS domain S-box-containing protein
MLAGPATVSHVEAGVAEEVRRSRWSRRMNEHRDDLAGPHDVGSPTEGILHGVPADLPGVVYRGRADEARTMVGLTRAVSVLTGYEAVELLGRDGTRFGDLIHPEDLDRVRNAVHGGVASGQPFRVVYRIRTRSDGERWVLEQGRALETGEVTGYIQDVTGSSVDHLVKRQEELDRALRDTRHLRLLQEVGSLVSEETTLRGAGLRAVPVICERLGFSGGRVSTPDQGPHSGLAARVVELGTQWLAPLPPALEPEGGGGIATGVGVRIRSGDAVSADDGMAALVLLADRHIDPDPTLLSLLEQIGTQLGRVWEREHAQLERKAGEERFRELAEHIDDVFWIGSPADHAREYVSPAYRDIWGREPEGLATDPRSWLETVHPEDRERVEDVVRLRARMGYEIQYRILRPDGEVRFIWDRAFPVMDRTGAVTRVVGVAEDVSERTKLEAQLRAAHRMEAVGRLAGGIAHDFNNLLTVIRAQSDFLLMDLPEESPLIEEVEVVRSAADRAAKLTRQLLAFSREQVLRPRVVDLVEVVKNMEQLLVRVLGEDVRIGTDFESDLPPVRVDPAQLEQVLMNLAVNARDAMPDGGRMTLSVRQEVLTAEVVAGRTELVVGDAYVRLDVTDTGHGMDETVRARIFEPFYTTKRASGGTGLGLAMAYGIVKQSGGTIHVSSLPGHGTTFTLRFPPVRGESLSPVSVVEAGPRGEVAGSILVVEDDPAVRRVSRRTLTREGLEVRVAADAESGLDILDEPDSRISFLLTDLILPGMSGRALLERVRRTHPNVRCIAMSGYAEGSPGSRVDLPTDVVFLPKPFTPDALMRALAAVADRPGPA